MEENWLIFVTCCIACFILGVLIGMIRSYRLPKGTIVIEENEDKTRDCVRFILPLELEEIQKEKTIIFQVIDKTSQKIQSL